METMLAKKYAHAFTQVYESELSQENITRVCAIADELESLPDVLAFLKIPHSGEYFSQSLKVFFVSRKLDGCFLRLIELLGEHKRLFLLIPILKELCVRYNSTHTIKQCSVVSAHNLSDEEKRQIEEILQKRFKENLQINFATDVSLIAGLRIQVNGYVWEHSLKSELKSIQRSLGVAYGN